MAKIKPATRPRTKRDDQRYEKLVKLAVSLPEVKVTGDRHKAITIRKKTLAYYCDDHHGDGVVGLWVKSTHDTRDAFVASDPKHFFVPPYVGVSGWVAMRMDQPRLDWDVLQELLVEAYRLQAPKTLASLV